MAGAGDGIGIFGIAYKPDTYIAEESAGLYLAQKLKHLGYRVFVHDYVATPANSPSLIEFEVIGDLEGFSLRTELQVAVICSPSPQYRSLKLPAGTKLLDPWGIVGQL